MLSNCSDDDDRIDFDRDIIDYADWRRLDHYEWILDEKTQTYFRLSNMELDHSNAFEMAEENFYWQEKEKKELKEMFYKGQV